MTLEQLLDTANVSQLPDTELARRLAKLAKINASLMQRVERSMDQQANAFSLFQTAIGLEAQVRVRTEELKSVLANLERANAELTGARDAAERANRFKTRFFTSVGHDLLQPLHAARLSLSALAGGKSESMDERLTQQIDHALSTVEDMLRTILDLSKLDAGFTTPVLQPVALSGLFNSLAVDLGPTASAKGLTLRVYPAGLCVYSDPMMLRRILQNLLANAVRYTKRGGILLTARQRSDRVRIEVWDTGPGISESERIRVFEEFQRGSASQQASGGGFGLGLSIVQRMAAALDYPLNLSSEVGRGTRFSLSVPQATINDVEQSPGSVETFRHLYGFAGEKVAIIDNDRAVLEAMRALLERWNCEPICLTSVTELEHALSACGTKPGLVLADYHLDHGETGLAAVQWIRQKFGAGIPVIVITADQSQSVSGLVRDAGCDILCKPVRPAELRALMQHLLQSKASSDNASGQL